MSQFLLFVFINRFFLVDNLLEHKETTGKVFIEVLDLEGPADDVTRTVVTAGPPGVLPSHMFACSVHLGAAPGQAVHCVLQGAANVGDVLVSEGEDAGDVGGGETAGASRRCQERSEEHNHLHSRQTIE